ncbi:hypothetical protein A0O34_07465 [Chryseobacterium glaciei]|uniref:Uncharacterized protein n=1 Tax=Chryseobacterium glaciei TaxID=1685010 RepID=A0A172XU46_9FLAO|nr:hypothetical protein [Chryseobacterium glaciei]ANF50362.1 hypothetical protein A0O34_07465 [Chryseobacterium glaciei]
MEKDYKIHYLVMLEVQRLAGTNIDFLESFRKMTDNEITAFIDKAIINYPHQKIEASTDKLTLGFYSYLFVEWPN